MPKDLHELPKLRDSMSYLYIEHAKIDKDAMSISAWDSEGKTQIPCAVLSLLMLGPGTSITQEAVRVLGENGTTILWCGEEGVRFYAQGMGETRKAYKLLKQAELVSDPEKRLKIVKRMYAYRFGDSSLADRMELEELRGREGVRVRQAYYEAARCHGIEWHGRNYDRSNWSSGDPVNQALSCANSCLYGISHAAIVSAGYSPALGFIHTGKQLSFVYDISDLYKVEMAIPVAFEEAKESFSDLERRVRIRLRETFREKKLLARIVSDIDILLSIEDQDDQEPEDERDYDEDEALPGPLWNGE